MLIDQRPSELLRPASGTTGDVDLRSLLATVGRARRYPRGSLVLAEGDAAHEVLLVTRGSVKVTVGAPDGRQVLIDLLDRGALLGELAVLDGERRSATAIALTSLEVVAVPTAEFRRLLSDHDGVAFAVVELLVTRLRVAAQRHVELGAADAVARVCSRLDELARRYGRIDHDGRIAIDSPITQLELGQWAGLSREAVVKALRSLRRVGWLDVSGRAIVIRDLDALRSRAAM